jgi:predicted transcriptional regulator
VEKVAARTAPGNCPHSTGHTTRLISYIETTARVVCMNVLYFLDAPRNITEEETYQCKILRNDTVKINTQNPDTYRKFIRHLNSEKIIHHTYQMKQDRAYRVVIRNLYYSMPIEEIKEELKKKEHTVRNILNIRQRVNKHPLSMFYVDLEPKENNKEIYNLQYLNNMKINVEPPYKKNTVIQCTRCQLYGHSKTHCKRPYKCVKCGGNHMTTERQKSKETLAKCALCSGEHTANYCTGLYSLQGLTKCEK